eukprot:2028639-Amphidinium_carterae.1
MPTSKQQLALPSMALFFRLPPLLQHLTPPVTSAVLRLQPEPTIGRHRTACVPSNCSFRSTHLTFLDNFANEGSQLVLPGSSV